MNKPITNNRSNSSVGQNKQKSNKRQFKHKKAKHNTPVQSHKLLLVAAPLVRQLTKLQILNDESKGSPYNDLILNTRTMMRGMFAGDRPYNFYMANVGNITTFSTTGTIATVINFYTDISAADNWTALASIFDEFTYVRSNHQFSPFSNAFNISNPDPTFTAFDDDGISAVPSSELQVTAYPTCKMMCPAIQGATLATEANSTGFYPYRRDHARPYPHTNSSVSNVQTTGWVDCASPSYLLGCLLMFNGAVSASSNTVAYRYMAQYEVAFRCVR